MRFSVEFVQQKSVDPKRRRPCVTFADEIVHKALESLTIRTNVFQALLFQLVVLVVDKLP